MKPTKKEQPKKKQHTVDDAYKYFSESPHYKKYIEQTKPTTKPSSPKGTATPDSKP